MSGAIATHQRTEWCGQRQDAAGNYSAHYPIDDTAHGNRVADGVDAWGCNACGIGWPCLVVRSRTLMGKLANGGREHGPEVGAAGGAGADLVVAVGEQSGRVSAIGGPRLG